MEAFCYAVRRDLDGISVFGLEGAVFEGGGEEVNNRQRQALAGVGRLRFVSCDFVDQKRLAWRTIVVVFAWFRLVAWKGQ